MEVRDFMDMIITDMDTEVMDTEVMDTVDMETVDMEVMVSIQVEAAEILLPTVKLMLHPLIRLSEADHLHRQTQTLGKQQSFKFFKI